MIVMLLEAAARALALAMITGVLLWAFRIRNVFVLRAAWTVVLFAAVCMPALMRSPWVPKTLQWRPQFHREAAVLPAATETQRTFVVVHSSAGLGSRSPAPKPAGAATPPPLERSWNLPAVLLALYGVVATLLVLRLMAGLVSAVRLWRHAAPNPPLSTDVPVRVSPEVGSPVTIGSGVVLPSQFERWTPEKLRAVLAHECAHVRHFDFYLQLLASLYSAVFWFSPLGWWLRRRLAVLAETISDQAGIAGAVTRTEYAEIVLHFAAAPRRPLTGVAMACTGNVSRRIEQLLNEDLYRAAFSHGRKRASVVFLFVTMAVLGTSLMLRVPSARAAQVAPAVTPVIPVAPVGNPVVPAEPVGSPAVPAEPVASPAVPAAPIGTPAVPQSLDEGQSSESRDDTTTYSFSDSDHGDSYALVDGSKSNVTFSGDFRHGLMQEEIDRARHMANDGKFLWFHHNGKSYVITDPMILAEVKALYAPMEELGRQQEELGKKQEALGKQQEELGRKQEQASLPAPDLSREIAELNSAIAKLQAMKGKETTQEQLADIQGKLADMQSRIGDLQGKIGEKQGSFGAEQGKLGEEQGKLGEQQGKLGEQQGKLAQQADKKVRAVIDESLKNGKAKPVQ